MRGAVILAVAALAASAIAPGGAAADEGPAAFSLTERSDFSRYIDGRYVGHAYRESRGALRPVTEALGALRPASDPSAASGAQAYAGEFLILEETLRDLRSASRRVDRTAPVRLTVAPGGGLEVQEDSGYPSLRGLPAFPRDSQPPRFSELERGATWVAAGTRALDFDDSGSFVLMPFLAEYRFLGTADYRGRRAYSLSAAFATRWKAGAKDATPVKGATGSHVLDILLDAESLSLLFIRDRFDETFTLSGGGATGASSSERRSGFSLYFFEGSLPFDRRAAGDAMAAAVRRSEGGQGAAAAEGAGAPGAAAGAAPQGAAATNAAAAGAGPQGAEGATAGAAAPEALPPGAGPGPLLAGEGPAIAEVGERAEVGDPSSAASLGAAGLELDASPEGLVLRVKDLRFVADSDLILPAERGRIDAIAAALKALPGRSFLVAGHSAAVGKAAGELELSIRRAKRVADELAARGIEASRLMYRGFGSSRPLAPNDSEEGRAKNRRVEITVLE